MEAILIINTALMALAALLSSLALVAVNKLRQIVMESIQGGNESAGSVRGGLVETKQAIANLDAQVAAVNTKLGEHERALGALKTTVEEVRGIVRPSTASASATTRA